MSMRFVLGLIIGLALGSAIALALAPQPGSSTRQRLWEQVRERAKRSNGVWQEPERAPEPVGATEEL